MTLEERNKLIIDNLDLVSRNVNKLLKRSSITIDTGELTNHLNLSLVLAANKFDPDKGVPFRRYADNRLGYSAISYLRLLDHLPVMSRYKSKEIDKIQAKLSHVHLRDPTDDEVADCLGVPISKYRKLLQELHSVSFFSIISDDNPDSPFDIMDDEHVSSDILKSNSSTPEDLYFVLELTKVVVSTFNKYGMRNQLAYILYFIHNFSLEEISSMLNTSNAWLSINMSKINNNINKQTRKYIHR